MKFDLVDFSEKERFITEKLYDEGYSIEEISAITSLSFYEVIYILRHIKDNLPVDQLVSFKNIEEDKLLFLSDTHIGSIYENMDYINTAYKIAKEKGIHTVLHGGDLMQSTISNVADIYQDEKKQLEHIVRDYPYDSSIHTYILLGNHDFNTLKKSSYYMDILKERDDFTLLGFKRAYLSWNNHLISLCHTTKKYHLSIPSVENMLNLKGHSHKLSYNKVKSIDIPTISDDLLYHKNTHAGFLTGTMEHNNLEIGSYYFDDTIYYEGPILKKKIK